jgi:hypothetical protein
MDKNLRRELLRLMYSEPTDALMGADLEAKVRVQFLAVKLLARIEGLFGVRNEVFDTIRMPLHTKNPSEITSEEYHTSRVGYLNYLKETLDSTLPTD